MAKLEPVSDIYVCVHIYLIVRVCEYPPLSTYYMYTTAHHDLEVTLIESRNLVFLKAKNYPCKTESEILATALEPVSESF